MIATRREAMIRLGFFVGYYYRTIYIGLAA
jgi:hypothetical protein